MPVPVHGGWPRKRIADLAQHSLGKMLDKAKNRGEPRPYLRNLNVRWFDFDLSDLLEMRFLPSEAERYSVRKGDVVVCEGGYPGRAAIWEHDESIYFQKALHRVRFHEPERAKWFLYYLHAKDLDGTLKKHFNGAGIQHFTGEALAHFALPLPPLPEQQRIVAILDEAFEGIATARANAERNLRNARALFESQSSSVFAQRGRSWIEKPLSEYAEAVSTGPFGSMLHQTDYVPDGVPLVNPINIVGDAIIPDAAKGVNPATAERLRRYVLRTGDVVVARRGEIGRCAVVDQEHAGWMCGTGCFFVRPFPTLDSQFLARLLRSAGYRNRLERVSTGTTMKNLSNGALGALVVAIPELAKQRQIAAELEALSEDVERIEMLYDHKLAALDELKQSLLHHAFTGQLTDRTLAAHAV